MLNVAENTVYLVISIRALVWSDRHECRSVECDMDTRLRLAIFHHISIRAPVRVRLVVIVTVVEYVISIRVPV